MSQITETFWVGDPCYVLGDVWGEVIDLLFPGYAENAIYGEHTLKDGRKFVTFSTAYGDGLYYDQFGRSYPVDAGMIGAIRLEDIRDLPIRPDLGNLHNLTPSAVYENSYSEDGTIVIGGEIRVETDPQYEEYEDGYEDEDN